MQQHWGPDNFRPSDISFVFRVSGVASVLSAMLSTDLRSLSRAITYNKPLSRASHGFPATSKLEPLDKGRRLVLVFRMLPLPQWYMQCDVISMLHYLQCVITVVTTECSYNFGPNDRTYTNYTSNPDQ